MAKYSTYHSYRYIIASYSSFVILCLLLASIFIYRGCHGSANLASVNPNFDNRPPNRSSNVEYETIDEIPDAIVPNHNVPMTTMKTTSVETSTDYKSSCLSSSGDFSSLSHRPLSNYLNPFCFFKC